MRYLALATDYDGTLAHEGRVDQPTMDALQRLKDSGRKLLLVTGRRMDDLKDTFDGADAFDIIVAENGALLHFPADGSEIVLSPPPSPGFVEGLRQRHVDHAVGSVIVATWEEHQAAVLDAIRESGLELQMIFNKGALMILPGNVNKASGLKAALDRLHLSAHNTVAIGDAENDQTFLASGECSFAVSNALPSLKERADGVTKAGHGAGVAELIDRLIADDLRDMNHQLHRHDILLGTKYQSEEEVRLPAYGANVLLAGASGGGKSTLATGFLERLTDSGYQFLAIDPEGDYEKFEGAIVLGDVHHAPNLTEVMTVLDQPSSNVIVNLLGIPVEDRPNYFETLLPRIIDLRARTGRPHWVVVDEAHHLLPQKEEKPTSLFPDNFEGLFLITLQPDCLPVELLKQVQCVLAAGDTANEVIASLAQLTGRKAPAAVAGETKHGVMLKLGPQEDDHAVKFQVAPCRSQRTRHRRKYAEGELTDDRSFFFRGPSNKLNLRANNLKTFIAIMQGVDDETWTYHLEGGEYSKWFRENIKSDDLAEAGEEIEKSGASPDETRRLMKEAIEQRFLMPA